LVDGGYSVRDVAGALDVTPGRISQLANTKTKNVKTKKRKNNATV